jgi:hypothetical protein
VVGEVAVVLDSSSSSAVVVVEARDLYKIYFNEGKN